MHINYYIPSNIRKVLNTPQLILGEFSYVCDYIHKESILFPFGW